MVDSSIGGKTAVDVWAGKNLIGAFHQPFSVAIDVAFLSTLPLRHISNGMAEVIKVAIALDAAFFSFLERADVAKKVLAKDPDMLLQIVKRSAQLKISVVESDERDGGRRNILNVGHTIGHALEHLLAPNWLHGEAVAAGMVVEAYAALELGILGAAATIERLRRVLKLYGLPFSAPFEELQTEDRVNQVLELSRADKKANSRGEISCVLLAGVGSVGATITYSIPEDLLRMLLSPACSVRKRSQPHLDHDELVASKKHVRVAVPGSKSVSNRVLLLAALGRGQTKISGLLHAADTYVSLEALSVLGVKWWWSGDGSELHVQGSAGELSAEPGASIFLDNAGTASRFLAAAALWLPLGMSVELRGAPRMHERPVRPLVEALKRSGAQIDYLGADGCFPLRVHGSGGIPGGEVHLDSTLSSQFTSAVLMAGAKTGVELVLTGKLVSQPYVRMTAALMRQFGVSVEAAADGTRFVVPRSGCFVNPSEVAVEADASSATYPLALAALTPGLTVTVTNLGSNSLQGDAGFALLLQRMGCQVEQTATTTTVTGPPVLHAIQGDLDMADQTDAFLTMAVVAACASAGETTRIVGIANQRVKECDRIAAVAEGLCKCGVHVEELADGLAIKAGFLADETSSRQQQQQRKLIRCFRDHRVAMSFALLGLRTPGAPVVLLDKACVEKTFPNFWNMLARDFGMVVEAAPEREEEHKHHHKQVVEKQVKHVVLIGMRGCGKSTTGVQLARALGRKFVCTDKELEKKYDVGSLADLAGQIGMEEFRRREAAVLRELLLLSGEKKELLVVATGGGIVETVEGRDAVKANGTTLVVHIHREESDLLTYFAAGDQGRIALGEPLQQTWHRRKPLYEALAHRELFWSGSAPPLLWAERMVRRALEPHLCMPVVRVGAWTIMECLTLPEYPSPFLEEVGGDLAELRVDLLSQRDGLSVRRALAAVRSVRPVAWTLRSEHEGGRFVGSQQEYEEKAREAVLLGFDAVDLEAERCSPALQALVAESPGVHFILSQHCLTQRPTMSLLQSMAMRCRGLLLHEMKRSSNVAGATIKLVCRASEENPLLDNQIVSEFISQCRNGFCSLLSGHLKLLVLLVGSGGRLSRVQASHLSPCRSDVLPAPPGALGQFGVSELRSMQKSLGLHQASRLLLFGSPIAQSPSPWIHNAALAASNLSHALCYELHPAQSADAVLAAVRQPGFVGANVTVPLKEVVVPLCRRLSAAATAIGSVNTVWVDAAGDLCGDNTDWRGMAQLLYGIDLSGGVFVLGAGGTARAACFAARALGAARISIYNRSPARAATLAASFDNAKAVSSLAGELPPSLVISCVPGDAPAPEFPESWLNGGVAFVFECAYRPKETAVLQALRGAKRVWYGEELLLEQAVWAWQLWCARPAPREEMAKAMAQFLLKK